MKRPFLAGIVGLLLYCSSGYAQNIEPTGYIRSLFLKYLQQEPTPEQMQDYLNQLRTGSTTTDVHANVLGSDAYFARQQGDPTAYVNGAFAEAYGRTPSPNEVDHWTRRLRDYRGDRVRWASEFLKGAGGQLPPGLVNAPAAVPAGDRPQRLLTTCQLLLQATQTECPGRPGWLLQNQSQNFIATVRTNLDVLQNPAAFPERYDGFRINMQAGIDGMYATLRNTGFPAPETRLHLEQVQQLLNSLPQVAQQPQPIPPQPVPPQPIPPPLPVPPEPIPQQVAGELSREDYQRLRPLANDLERKAQDSVNVFRAIYRRTPGSNGILNDIQGFANRADNIRDRIRAGYSVAKLQSNVSILRRDLLTITTAIQAAPPNGQAIQSWQETVFSFNAFATAVGVGGVEQPQPGAPGLIPMPKYLPQLLDQAMNQCDILIAGYSPYLYQHPSIPPFVSELRDLRNRFFAFRQATGNGLTAEEAQLQRQSIRDQLESVNRRWQRVARSNVPNPPNLGGLVEAAQNIDRSFGN